MSQHDMDIGNNSGLGFRSDLNLALKALASNSAGPTEPTTKYAFQFWMNTTTGVLQQRNAGNTAWANFVPSGAVPISGGTMTGNLGLVKNAPTITLDRQDGAAAVVIGRYTGLARWQILYGDSTPETGGNAGSNFTIHRFNDAGTLVGSVFAANRATGEVTIPAGLVLGAPPTISGVPMGHMVRRTYLGPGSFTWTKPVGLRFIDVEIQAAGGGGGGAQATAASQGSVGGGAGAGGYARKLFAASDLSAAYTITIGAAGIGVSGGNGTTGATTQFGALMQATGGGGGTVSAASGSAGVNAYGGSGGTGVSGDVNGSGGRGFSGMSIPFGAGASWSGRGVDTPWGAGGIQLIGSSDGGAAAGSGGGGGGACNGQSQAAKTGGNGGSGLVLVTEYY